MCKYAANYDYQRNTHKKSGRCSHALLPLYTLQCEANAHKNFHFRKSAPSRALSARSNAKWGGIVVVFGVASSSHTATGDGFNGKHNILQVNIAQNRTLHILQRCSGEDRIEFLHIPTAAPPGLRAFFHLTRISCVAHQDLSCVMCHRVTSCDPRLAFPAPHDCEYGSCTVRAFT